MAASAPSSGQEESAAAPQAGGSSARLEALFRRGVEAMKEERWQAAHAALLAAWKLERHFQIAANLGLAELRLGKHRDAAEHLAFVLREAPDEIKPSQREHVRRSLEEARQRVAALRIAVNRDGAQIFVEGAPVGTSPLIHEIYVEPGARTVEARLPNGATRQVSVDLLAGHTRRVGLMFWPEPVPADARAPATPRDAPPRGGLDRSSIAILGIGGGMSAVAIGVGIAATALSFSKAGEQDTCQTESCFRLLESSRTNLANVAVASFVIGGLALGGTLTYAIVRSQSRAGTSAAVGVRVSAAAQGALVTGSW
jgi:hypothetical protein